MKGCGLRAERVKNEGASREKEGRVRKKRERRKEGGRLAHDLISRLSLGEVEQHVRIQMQRLHVLCKHAAALFLQHDVERCVQYTNQTLHAACALPYINHTTAPKSSSLLKVYRLQWFLSM